MESTREKALRFSTAEIGYEKREYWNQEGTWPTDYTDREQNPWGRPKELYCPTAGGLNIDVAGAMAEKMAYNTQRADHKPENRSDNGKRY